MNAAQAAPGLHISALAAALGVLAAIEYGKLSELTKADTAAIAGTESPRPPAPR